MRLSSGRGDPNKNRGRKEKTLKKALVILRTENNRRYINEWSTWDHMCILIKS